MFKKAKLIIWLLCLILFIQFEGVFNPVPSAQNVCAATNSLSVQFFNSNKSSTSNMIYPQFQITNTGTNSVNFSDIKIRYYYTINGECSQSFWCDWSSAGISNVTGTFVKMTTPQTYADYYLEIGFTSAAGSLASGGSIVVQTRFAKTNYSTYTQDDDFSFNNYASNYVDWTMVPAFIADTLAWGTYPGMASPTATKTPTYTPTNPYTNTPTGTPINTSTNISTRIPTNTPTKTIANTPTKITTSTPAGTSTPTKVSSPTPTLNNLAQSSFSRAYTDSQTLANRANAAIDGKIGTWWSTGNSSTSHYLEVDLGGFYNLTGTEIYWKKPLDKVNKYKIEVSPNEKTWIKKVDNTTADYTDSSDIKADVFNATFVRYIRITVYSNTWEQSIYELKVYDTVHNIQTYTPVPTGSPSNTCTPTVTPTSTDNTLYEYAPAVASDSQILQIVRATPTSSVKPTIKLYDKQTLDYSLSGSMSIQAPKKNKGIVLALDTSAERSKIFDYTLFSGSSSDILMLNANNFYVKGNVHTNNTLSTYTSSAAYEGNVEAVNAINAGWGIQFKNGSVYTNNTSGIDSGVIFNNSTLYAPYNVPVVDMPASLSENQLTQLVQQSGGTVYDQSHDFASGTLNLDNPIYCNGNVTISTSAYTGKGLIAASGTITIIATSAVNQNGGGLCIYSNAVTSGSTAAISVNLSSGTFYGLIYAPHGTVVINASNTTIYGKIIAQSIQISQGNTTIIDQYDPTLASELSKLFSQNRLNLEKQAAIQFIDDLKNSNINTGIDIRMSVVSYAKTAAVYEDANSDNFSLISDQASYESLKSYINSLQSSAEYVSGTYTPMRNIGDGMRRAYYLLDNLPDINTLKYVIVFSDGETNARTVNAPSSSPFISDGNGTDVKTSVDDDPASHLTTAAGYAKYFGSLIESSYYKPYFISISGAISQLEEIAAASGADIVTGSTHYYISSSPAELTTNTNIAASKINQEVKFIEYADDLRFTTAYFDETFPKGVKVLSVAAPYDYLTVEAITSGPDKGKYRVYGNIEALVLCNTSTDSTTGSSTYTLKYKNTVIDPVTGDTTYSAIPVPHIKINIRYTSLYGTKTKVGRAIYEVKVDYIGNTLEYLDYFGKDGKIKAQDTTQSVRFNPDVF